MLILNYFWVISTEIPARNGVTSPHNTLFNSDMIQLKCREDTQYLLFLIEVSVHIPKMSIYHLGVNLFVQTLRIEEPHDRALICQASFNAEAVAAVGHAC